MRYARKYPFTACVDDEVEYRADEIEKLAMRNTTSFHVAENYY